VQDLSERQRHERQRAGMGGGPGSPGVVAFALLNLGIQTVALGGADSAPSFTGLLGRCAEGLAAGAFALHAWPRVKLFTNEDRGAERVRRSE
jgi:hypothetical protein